MNVFAKLILLSIFMTLFFSIVPMSTAASGWTRAEPYKIGTAYATSAGYFIQRKLLEETFFQYEITQRYFGPLKVYSPYTITPLTLIEAEPIVDAIEAYINKQKKGIMIQCEDTSKPCAKTFESINGISERDLAFEITKASYCFGTDPFVVTSKIRQESRFDMTSVSSTGAIGLTQLTSIGLEEILDQLGHRGPKYAFEDNQEFLLNAIECYTQDKATEALKNFPEVKTVPIKDGKKVYTNQTIKSLKAWVLPKKSSGPIMPKDRKLLIQRQLFMGQILLKIYLAYSKKVLKNQPMARQYEAALRMFNGDNIRVKYAKEVMRYSQHAQTL